MNEREVQIRHGYQVKASGPLPINSPRRSRPARMKQWHRNGEQKISGVRMCPIRFYLPHGFLVVMSRADKVPAGRVDVSHDFLSNGFVSDAEARAASLLIGRNQDTSKPHAIA